MQYLVSLFLHNSNHTLEIASSVDDATELMAVNSYDLVIANMVRATCVGVASDEILIRSLVAKLFLVLLSW